MAGANRLRELRGGMSLDELSARSGVPRNAINLIENGRQELTLDKMQKLGRALGCAASALLNDEDVEFRADKTGAEVLEAVRAIPRGAQADAIKAATAVIDLARHLATQSATGLAFDGPLEQISQLARRWNAMDEDRRERALALLDASGFAETRREFRSR